MRFTQIAVASDTENGEALYALGEDGHVYELTSTHHRVGSIYQGRKVIASFYSPSFWRMVDRPFEEPETPAEYLKGRLEE
jgi:hypothetical protein